MTGHIGFTGTREGVTDDQLAMLRRALASIGDVPTLHHGDCVGADVAAHSLARAAGWRVVVHPPSNDRLRAWCEADEYRPEQDYLDRNAVIVAESDVLIACPKQNHEVQKGGTWWTVRHAREQGIPVLICWPDGRVK